MKERVIEMYRVLKNTGSIYLHCDWHASHYLRVMLDEVFGLKNFRNEIIWCYTGASSPGQNQFSRKHDVIFWYSKSDIRTFNENAIRIPYSESTLKRAEAGEKGGKSAESVFHGKRTKRTLHKKGKLPEDWWVIPVIGSTAKERLGYPTQKPEALLERIIKASSNENDVVFDPFCGCGTTLAVADRLKRKWVGIDISQTACSLMKLRLQNQGVRDVLLIGMPVTIDDLKKLKPFEFQNWIIIEGFNGTLGKRKVHDMGIDGYTFMKHEPIQVKQSENVGRNVIDNFETALKRDKKKKGFIVAFSFTKGSYEEVARTKHEDNLNIELMKVDEILQKKQISELNDGCTSKY